MESIMHYRNLHSLLEEDLQQARQSLQGDLLNAYEELVKKELAALDENLRLIQYYSNHI